MICDEKKNIKNFNQSSNHHQIIIFVIVIIFQMIYHQLYHRDRIGLDLCLCVCVCGNNRLFLFLKTIINQSNRYWTHNVINDDDDFFRCCCCQHNLLIMMMMITINSYIESYLWKILICEKKNIQWAYISCLHWIIFFGRLYKTEQNSRIGTVIYTHWL